MSNSNSQVVVGCLLDVSGSMRKTLEPDCSSELASERLGDVLRAALKLAQAERQQNPNALMFVGVFGLRTSEEAPNPPAVDLYRIADSLLDDVGNYDSGHDLLIARANQNNVGHISRYIRSKLSNREARIVNAYLRRHPEEVEEFVDAIPSEGTVNRLHWFGTVLTGGAAAPAAAATVSGVFGGAVSGAAGVAVGSAAGQAIEDNNVENSRALAMARRIQRKWLLDFTEFEPQPVSKVVKILQRFQDYEDHQQRDLVDDENDNQLDTLRRYMYGPTPMCHALGKALNAFLRRQNARNRVLVLISDGESTDGDPTAVANDLRNEGISIATVSLTEKKPILQRTLHCEVNPSWDQGTRTLFTLATRVSASSHPIPVLASVGWKIPSAGEIALFSSVCSATVLDEFCSLLLSARFGSADALLDVAGRIHFDDYINKAHLDVRRKPSNQRGKGNCYAHATASVVHMALLRVVSRDGGVPSLNEIRARILSKFPETRDGYDVSKVLAAACGWYRPLQCEEIDEDQARQAVLHRRPVLASFFLSKLGWDEFCRHFVKISEIRGPVLTEAQMAPYYSQEFDDGHAVVLVGCSPNSLTFLNSWGSSWGDNGSFSIENHSVLGLQDYPMRFYDVYWLESNLSSAEQQAYDIKVDEELHRHADKHPSIFELEYQCPKCQVNSPLAKFSGSVRRAICPNCIEQFEPEAGCLVQALYVRGGLNDVA
ncbi:hypothetical protein BKA59DRAFT_439300 [Fusarium tricinctum]|uniref:VWFA domain-containing protein n=1 Tax=Fusarium tricinctum TaxID=61284 RepID=A0A8K0S0A8_9HYPO|nr:hypothetical protein BKA59DRAFT_439300 [Fusarium tricinctum]